MFDMTHWVDWAVKPQHKDSSTAINGCYVVFSFGLIVYNGAIVYIHQNLLKVVVHMIIIDQ